VVIHGCFDGIKHTFLVPGRTFLPCNADIGVVERVNDRGREPATRWLHVALATFLCGATHNLGISQCEKGNIFLLLRGIDINKNVMKQVKIL
jgi:hypothetical protein